MAYPNQQGPGLTNSYSYGQSGYNNPLYANNYNPNQYTYGEPFAGSGLQGLNMNYQQNVIQGSINNYSSTPMYNNPYQYQGQAGFQYGEQPNQFGPAQTGTGSGAPNIGEAELQGGQGAQGGGGAATAGKVAAGVGAAVQVAQTAYGISQDYRQASEFDVDKALPYQQYHPRSAPPVYVKEEVPAEIAKGTGGRAALKYAGQGAAAGATVGSFFGPWGTVIGGAVGAIGGAVVGAFKGKKAKKKREEFERKQAQREAEYRQALGRYYDIQNQTRTSQAQQQQLNQRGQNIAPMYGASIYGFGNY